MSLLIARCLADLAALEWDRYFWARCVLVFVVVVLGDICWTKYTRRVNATQAKAAANWAVLLYGLGATSVENYTHDIRLIVPALLGAWVGTWSGVTFDGTK